MPESLMVIRSFSTLRKHWEWMTFSADSVSSVHTLTDDLPLESLADQPGAGNVHLLIPPEGFYIVPSRCPTPNTNSPRKHYSGWRRRHYPTPAKIGTGWLSINKTKVSR